MHNTQDVEKSISTWGHLAQSKISNAARAQRPSRSPSDGHWRVWAPVRDVRDRDISLHSSTHDAEDSLEGDNRSRNCWYLIWCWLVLPEIPALEDLDWQKRHRARRPITKAAIFLPGNLPCTHPQRATCPRELCERPFQTPRVSFHPRRHRSTCQRESLR